MMMTFFGNLDELGKKNFEDLLLLFALMILFIK